MKRILSITIASIFSLTLLAQDDTMIQKNNIRIDGDRMTPEALWAMGRIGNYAASPDGKQIVYTVAYYSVKQNKGHHMLFVMDAKGLNKSQLTTSAKNETDPAWIDGGKRIAFLTDGQLWSMNPDGTDRRQLTHDTTEIEGFKFSPDGSKVILIKSIPYHGSIKKNPSDLPKATGRLATDLNYRHWDHYVESIAHPFIAQVTADGIDEGIDILKDEPYECPMAPFGGIEQLDWSTDSKTIAYTCRKKEGVDYAISTDSDIFLYDLSSGKTTNLCKPAGYKAPEVDPTKTMATQSVNQQGDDIMVGYDTNPQFSPDGKYLGWLSMKRDGYESDRNRLCVYDLVTGKKVFLTESFDSNVDEFCWSDSKDALVYFIGVWHGKENIYSVNWKGEVKQLTACKADFGSLQMLNNGKQILAERHSYTESADLYVVTPGKTKEKTIISQITHENKHITDQLAIPTSEEHWTKTTDGKDLMYWVILPPHFDAQKKYPTLLFCEGGPQSPVSQFWSYRWNFMIMASQGYVVIAPNRRGLPGFGSEWCEQISGDWTGQCMHDYLSAIDDAVATLPYVDKDRLGAVGASFGGFSVYYLAGHHDKRFKCFIAHDGAFNLESMYTDTEEVWFSNWEYDDAYQGMGAFNAARLRGIPAELLIFPDENHWVLKPQNGILWQRTFFSWLDRWLKK